MNIPETYNQLDQWTTVMFLYNSALKAINTKIEILNNEFIHLYNYNPIEHIKSRLKTPESIVKKLKRGGHEVTIPNMIEHYLLVQPGYLPDRGDDRASVGCDGAGGEGLYQESEAERLQELPYGCDDPDLSKRWSGGYEGGDPDTDDSDGFLGKSGTQDLL